ncbi:MAG: hypothetical protein IPI67_03065 [Myxococcales bacterium]|nr:hypothetical protein [Myxococcales bacterium]
MRSPRLSARAQRSLLGALVLLFFFAFLSGRVAVPALLGWRSGLEAWISRSDDAAALLGQLTVVAGCLVAIQLLIAILVESDLSVGYRLIAAPTTAGIVTLVMAASTRELPLLLVIGLATLASFAALAASVPTVIEKHTRATGMVIGIAGLNSLLSVSARSLAVWASHEALTRLFRVAQVLATVAWVLDLVTLGIAIVWLTERRWKRALLVWGPVVALAIGLAIVSLYMTPRPDSVLGLLDKAVPVFLRHPWPVVPTLLHFALCLLLFFAVPAALFGRRQHPYAQSAVALALLARSGTDIPVLGLALLLASLLAALAAVRERPDAAAPLPQRPSQ